jgi:hypothetical protein
MEDKELIKQLEEENLRLKMALAESRLARHALESLVEVIDEHYQTDVKKIFGQQPSQAVPQKRKKT